MIERDPNLERKLLVGAGGLPEYADEVTARLDRAEAELGGNTGWERSVDALLQEMKEEAADISGWGVGVALRLGATELPERFFLILILAAVLHEQIENLRLEVAK